ncbi:hypothetical protein DFH09DRAFT_1286025 [Mycena vulgaris]|nr:hypothetical protein DFH09DRAFT_1286025 [Mycena vulgaris]
MCTTRRGAAALAVWLGCLHASPASTLRSRRRRRSSSIRTACEGAAAGCARADADAGREEHGLGGWADSPPSIFRKADAARSVTDSSDASSSSKAIVPGTTVDSGQMNLRWTYARARGGRRRLRDGGRDVGDGGGEQATFESPTWYDFSFISRVQRPDDSMMYALLVFKISREQ